MKKLITLGIALIILSTAVAGSIAFFTDSVSTDDNVITAGSIDVDQHEQKRVYTVDENGNSTYTLADFAQNQNFYPCVINANSARADIVVGNYTVQMYVPSVKNFMDKIVTAQNVGTSPSYIRTFVAVPAAVNGNVWIHLDCNGNTSATWDDTTWNWEQPENLRNIEINGAKYDIYVATYAPMLAAGSTTPPSLLGFYMDGRISNVNDQIVFVDDNGDKHPVDTGSSLSILVTTEATQTLTFTDAQHALTSTFGSIHDAAQPHHPWLKK